MNAIPRRITDDEHDKLIRRVWELEQKTAAQEKVVLNSLELDKLFENQRVLTAQVEKMQKQLSLLLDSVALLTRIENGRK